MFMGSLNYWRQELYLEMYEFYHLEMFMQNILYSVLYSFNAE